MSRFPENFKWGVACASYQCEGAWDADGKGPNIWDDFCHDISKEYVKNRDTGDVACDSYHRFREDIALMKAHNVQVYRFSISWARVMPTGEGEVNEKGLQFYDELVEELLANGIEPWMTLYHWDLPSALQNKGGWLNRDIVKAFGNYAELIAKRFKGRVTNFMTINEPQCIAQCGYMYGNHAPGYQLGEEKVALVYHNINLAHSEAQRRIKAVCGESTRVGIVPCGTLAFPEKNTPENIEASYHASFDLRVGWNFNSFLDPLILHRYDDSASESVKRFAASIDPADWDLMETPDFLGLNIYQGMMVNEKGERVAPYPGHPITALKWLVTPEVMRYGPQHIYRRYGLPMYITENGLSCHDTKSLDGKVHDPNRQDYMHRYLKAYKRAAEDGVDAIGYFAWSLMDNFEWAYGYTERFGMVYVDYTTQERIVTDSFDWYKTVMEQNGENL